MGHPRTLTTEAIVLKRKNVGEADKAVTLLTKDLGKVVVIAKGVRKLTSSKRAYLEPGNHIKAFLVLTASMPLLTQSQLITDMGQARANLKSIRQLSQILETVDKLFVEEQPEIGQFEEVLTLVKLIQPEHTQMGKIKLHLNTLLIQLGYPPLEQTDYLTIMDYVAELADKPIKSWEYLNTHQ